MAIREDLISNKYGNDGVPEIKLNENQLKHLRSFFDSPLIKYEKAIECCLCGSDAAILIAKKDCYGTPFDTVVCGNCGLIRAYWQLTEDSQKLFYEKYYRNIYDDLCNQEEKIIGRYKQEESTYIPRCISKKDIIVEIGCGGGWKLIPYHLKGFTYYGFDFDNAFIELGRKHGLNLYTGGIREACLMGIKADYLILSHVLEHVKNPITFLIELKKILKKNAIVSIWGPCLDLVPWGYLEGDFLAALNFTHNYFFSNSSLEKIGLKAGYKIVNSLGANTIIKNSDLAILDFEQNVSKGEKIAKSLKFNERFLTVKKLLKLDKIFFKYLYYLYHPFKSFKKFQLKYIG